SHHVCEHRWEMTSVLRPGCIRTRTEGSYMESNYWSRARVGRRSVLRGAGLGITGIAGAALIGCGGGDDDDGGGNGTPDTGSQVGAQLTATAVGTGTAGDTPVPADQVRVAPGIYDGPVGPSPAELNPGVNAKYGGV